MLSTDLNSVDSEVNTIGDNSTSWGLCCNVRTICYEGRHQGEIIEVKGEPTWNSHCLAPYLIHSMCPFFFNDWKQNWVFAVLYLLSVLCGQVKANFWCVEQDWKEEKTDLQGTPFLHGNYADKTTKLLFRRIFNDKAWTVWRSVSTD